METDPQPRHCPPVNADQAPAALTERQQHPAQPSCPPSIGSFRSKKKIDYTDPAVMKRRQLEKLRQRAHALAGAFVIGRWCNIDGKIVLAAIRRGAAYDIDSLGPLSTNASEMNLWNTKQAAHQWLRRNARPGCHIVNIDRLHDPEAPKPDELST